MKILMVNKFFYIKGGSETYYFSLKKLLESKGHTVIDFSMKDVRNFESEYSNFFVNNVDYNAKQNILKKVIEGLKIIYSLEAKRKFEYLIKKTKPDIIHLHIFQHQISSSIIDVAIKYKIPLVYTAHDLKALCPNYKMLNNHEICEKCKNNKYFNCTKYKCIKDSIIKSLIGTIEAQFNKCRKTYNKINYIITPSEFYRNKFIEFGYAPEKVVTIPNFLDKETIDYDILYNQKYFLYFGRLSEEKGILTLIKVFEKKDLHLKIVGIGPLKEKIQKYINDNNIKNIEMLGFKSGRELYTIVGNAKAVILPSEWYENGPYSAIETLKLGIPLIGSDLGGIPELIEDSKNGFIFKHANVEDLNKCINKIENLNENEIFKMQKKSKEIFLNNYTAEEHYKKIIEIYKKGISLSKSL